MRLWQRGERRGHRAEGYEAGSRACCCRGAKPTQHEVLVLWCRCGVGEAYVKSKEPQANGATWGPGNKKCYAEFGMTGQNSNSDWQTCKFKTKGAICLLINYI